MKVVSVVGARPQFIKAAMVSRALRARPGVREVLVHTGQHYDETLSAVFFQDLSMPEPDHHLGIGSDSHGAQTGRMLEALEAVLMRERPDRVLVFGDTNSTLAGALAAAKLDIGLAHVEAGLRSFNRAMPEEVNRVLTDHAADLLFAPTEAAVANLRREGIPESRVHLVGDVMYDAARLFGARAGGDGGPVRALGLAPGSYVLATVHRAENTDDEARLGSIFEGLEAVAREVPVVAPLHPRTREALAKVGALQGASRALRLLEPVGYLEMLALERDARLIVTDSGGVQKEAFFFRVPCITLREETEWVELVELGWNRLVPPGDSGRIAESVRGLLARPEAGREVEALYGGGRAAERVVEVLFGAAG